jgi:hypothetical protein
MAFQKDLEIDQGADWPGEGFGIVDSVGNPKILTPRMVASGAIAGPDGTPVFTWSSTPTPEQGLVVFQASLYIPTVDAAHNVLWTFSNAPYQLYLHDPDAPFGDRDIRVAEGTIYLSRKIG